MSKTRKLLQHRRKEIATEIASLQVELNEADTALAAIEGKRLPSTVQPTTRRASIASQALDVLEKYPQGLPTRQIAKKVNELRDKKVTKHNMSWHLSHLKREGRLVLDGELWSIAPTNDETLDVPASSASGNGDGTPLSNESQEGKHDLLG